MKTILIQPNVPVPGVHGDASAEPYDFAGVRPVDSETCPRCGMQECDHSWQVFQDGHVIDCLALYEATAEYLLNDDVRANFEVAFWPGLPGERGYWSASKVNVEPNLDRVVWKRVDAEPAPERVGETMVWSCDGVTYRESATFSIVLRKAAGR